MNTRRSFSRIVMGLLLSSVMLLTLPARADRLRDLCDVQGVRDNQLVGYGVVTGLNGTGDDLMAPFAYQSLLALMRRLGVQIDNNQLRLKNVAAVLITADLPPFARAGGKIDVTVSSIGNARSLQGGVLIQTLLHGADMHVYAVAQGPLIVGGFDAAGGSGSSIRQNITTTARVPNGASIERAVVPNFVVDDTVTLDLKQPDFTTAARIVDALVKELGAGTAIATDAGAVRVKVPADMKASPTMLLSRINDVDVSPASPSRVVINERTGTIVAGGDIRLAPVAISQGGITVVVKEKLDVSQPTAPFSNAGTTVVTPNSDVQANESAPPVAYIDGAATLSDVARALTSLGVGPRDLASILQGLKSAGALNAEIIVQ